MKDEIRNIIKGDVDDSSETLLKYSHDASLFEITPALVVYPKDSSDIQALVKWVKDHKKEYPTLSITPRAAGTDMSGGPLNDSIILDTSKYMNIIGEVRRISPYMMVPKFPGSHEVTITGEVSLLPGAFYRDLESKTLPLNLLLPCYTASKSINALGGMVGNNSGGELTLRYGKTEDYVKALKIVLNDGNEYTLRPLTRKELYGKIAGVGFEGELYKKLYGILEENREVIEAAKPNVSKNSAGYNLWNVMTKGVTSDEDIFDPCQLIVGSQGTFGIVTEITLRLVDLPQHTKLAVVFLQDTNRLGEIVDEILLTKPLSVESYDDKTFKLGVKFFREFVHAKGIMGSLRFGLSFVPEFTMSLLGGIPAMILLVEYDGESETLVHKKCVDLIKRLTKFKLHTHITRGARESEKYWEFRRDSFSLLRKHAGSMRTAPFIDDFIVRPEFLPEFLPKLNALLSNYPSLIYTIAGHAANGNFHIIPLMDVHATLREEIILKLSESVYNLVLEYKGSITAEHNDGIIRSPFLKQMYGDKIYSLFQQVKNLFDPETIFNPHKKVGVGKEDIVKYLQH